MKTRFLLGAIAFVTIFMFPWWTAWLVVFVLLWRYQPYYEAPFFGVLLDALYMLRGQDAALFGFPFTFSFLALIILSLYVKEQIRVSM